MSRLTPEEFWRRYGNRIVVHPVTGCWLWQGAKNESGYANVRHDGRVGKLHRLSLEVHRPGSVTPEKPCALHNCPGGDRPNCLNPAHLWAGTVADNNRDMVRKGRHESRTKPERVPRGARHGAHTKPDRRPCGERNGLARLTAQKVSEIRRRYAAGGRFVRTLAREFGMSRRSIQHIISGRTWAHVPYAKSSVPFQQGGVFGPCARCGVETSVRWGRERMCGPCLKREAATDLAPTEVVA